MKTGYFVKCVGLTPIVFTFAGVICMWFLYPIIGERAAMKLGLAIIFFIRIISVYFNINLPVLKRI
jgi:uncharacterized membrane protein YeiH